MPALFSIINGEKRRAHTHAAQKPCFGAFALVILLQMDANKLWQVGTKEDNRASIWAVWKWQFNQVHFCSGKLDEELRVLDPITSWVGFSLGKSELR